MTLNDTPAFRTKARLPRRKPWIVRTILSMRGKLIVLRIWFLRRFFGMDIHPGCRISLKANLDRTNPSGIHIDDGTYVAFGAVVLAHDMSRVLTSDTYIGKNCFIGAHAIILPGVRIGDECIVAAGSVVTHDVPSHCVVAGNPAKVMREGITTVRWGILKEHHEAGYREGAPLRDAGVKL
jgi:acetyltransferase-like isoleucine patch superfamily enzyme